MWFIPTLLLVEMAYVDFVVMRQTLTDEYDSSHSTDKMSNLQTSCSAVCRAQMFRKMTIARVCVHVRIFLSNLFYFCTFSIRHITCNHFYLCCFTDYFFFLSFKCCRHSENYFPFQM